MDTKPGAWYSKHPSCAPYFLEFIPLAANGGGIDKFNEAMAFARFIPEDGIQGNISEAERTYIASLIAHAHSLGKRPVLSCTRTLGRLPAIKKAFPGFHILIYRNLFRQWCSYTEQYARGNPYFFNTVKWCIDHSGHDKFLGYLKEAFPLDDCAIGNGNYFCAFAALHIYLYAQAADAADMIFDVEKAACNKEYLSFAEREIKQGSGLDLNLSNIKESIGFSFLDGLEVDDLKERIKIITDMAISSASTQAGREFGVKARAGLIEEWDKYAFYAGTLSSFAGPRGLLRERDALAAEKSALLGERDALLAGHSTLTHERDALVAERGSLLAERDALLANRSALMHERGSLPAPVIRFLRKCGFRKFRGRESGPLSFSGSKGTAELMRRG